MIDSQIKKALKFMKESNIWKLIITVALGWKILEFIILYEENRVFKKVKTKKKLIEIYVWLIYFMWKCLS